jgi:hypothetical protein
MAQPLGSRLRPARHSGLTSPDQVRTPDAATAADPSPHSQDPDKPQKRQRRDTHARKAPGNANAPKAQPRIQPVDRG